MHTYWQVRILLLIIALIAGGGVAVWNGTLDYRAAVSETSPTSLAVDAFQEYQGQRWLKIEKAVFATDQAVIRAAPQEPGQALALVMFYLPLVPKGWRPGDPVHVICKLGPGPRDKVAGWLQENGGGSLHSFTGVLANEPPGLHFPGLTLGKPAILLREGRPDGPESSLGIIVLGGIMIVAGVVLGVWLVLRGSPTPASREKEGG